MRLAVYRALEPFNIGGSDMTNTTDVLLDRAGSIVGITPITQAAREWIKEHCHVEPWQWLGETLNVELRYVGDIAAGMQRDGLNIE